VLLSPIGKSDFPFLIALSANELFPVAKCAKEAFSPLAALATESFASLSTHGASVISTLGFIAARYFSSSFFWLSKCFWQRLWPGSAFRLQS
jgi:hypothetical protein